MPVYKEKNGTWRVNYRYTDWTGELKQSTRRGFATRREAVAWEHEQSVKKQASLDMTFGSFTELYISDMKCRLKENTWESKEHIIRTKILPYFKDCRIGEIEPRDVVSWQNTIMKERTSGGKTYSQTYLKTIHNQLSAIFNHAVRYYGLSKNPAKLAENVDPSRSHLNIEYCNEDLHDVYHELFNAAVERYNAKQKRKDRMIDDYYEKIRSGKQEKRFHEIIIQIGDCETCGAATGDGKLAAEILDEYMKGFQERNPNLRVFSAHLHMDEVTPHLHIDFVPFTTGSDRGLDTRVSLKKALAAQGFFGGTRSETEWNQWANAEKEALAAVMERHEIAWEKKGTHEEHLSVLEFKKKERAAEVAELEEQKVSLQAEVMDKKEVKTELDNEIADAGEKLRKARQKFAVAQADLKTVEAFTTEHIRDPEEWLPEPGAFESAKAYRKKILPIFRKVVKLIQPLYSALVDLKRKYRQVSDRL